MMPRMIPRKIPRMMSTKLPLKKFAVKCIKNVGIQIWMVRMIVRLVRMLMLRIFSWMSSNSKWKARIPMASMTLEQRDG